MSGPLVTVYIPTKNRSHLLQRALESVYRQTYRPLEVIVVDDGSTDETPGLLVQWRARHPDLVCLRNEVSTGGAAARNKAIEAARGDFVTGLDDDDEFLPDRVERFVADWFARERRGERLSALYAQDVSRRGADQAVTRKPLQVDWRDLCRLNMISNQVFTPRSHLEAIGMFDPVLPMWQDLECWIRLTARFGPAGLTDAATYVFHMDAAADRVSLKGKERLLQAYEHVATKHRETMGTAQRRALFLQMFADHYPTEAGWGDVRTFVRAFGPHVPGIARLARVAMRQRASAFARRLKEARR